LVWSSVLCLALLPLRLEEISARIISNQVTQCCPSAGLDSVHMSWDKVFRGVIESPFCPSWPLAVLRTFQFRPETLKCINSRSETVVIRSWGRRGRIGERLGHAHTKWKNSRKGRNLWGGRVASVHLAVRSVGWGRRPVQAGHTPALTNHLLSYLSMGKSRPVGVSLWHDLSRGSSARSFDGSPALALSAPEGTPCHLDSGGHAERPMTVEATFFIRNGLQYFIGRWTLWQRLCEKWCRSLLEVASNFTEDVEVDITESLRSGKGGHFNFWFRPET